MKRSLAIAVSLLTLAFVSGCGGDDPDDTTDPETSTSQSSSEETSEEPEESSEPPTEATVLTAMVGNDADPDAFEITLVDDSGANVTELPAGDYTINVVDPSTIHNFHLTGGSVDETTAVDEVVEVTWEVTLEAGDYTFKCDPHPNMTGGFTVV